MTNFGAKILNNAVSSLRAQQAIIANTGNNISNVNTPGFTRRALNLVTGESRMEAGGINVGSGVRIGNTIRVADSFLQKMLFEAASETSNNEVQNEFMTRIEKLFNLTGDRSTIGSSLTNFFTAINDLTVNPSSIELRTNVIERAEDLVSAIGTTYDTLANLQTEADNRIATEIQTVNALTTQIADLNEKISQVEAGNSQTVAADERDQRDKLLQDLAEKLSYSQVELPDGSVTITLENGFALVNGGDSKDLSTTTSPSFVSGTLPPSLSGGVLSYIVYDYDESSSGAVHIDLTRSLKAGNGTIAGYLNMRGYADPTNTNAFQADGVLPQIASRVEALTRALLTDFNMGYVGGGLQADATNQYGTGVMPNIADRDGTADGYYDSSAVDLTGAAPEVFGLFDFSIASGQAKDRAIGIVPADGLPTIYDLDNILSNRATTGVTNFSSLLKVNSTVAADPKRIAAGFNLISAPGTSSADGRNIAALAALQTQTFNFSSGPGASFTVSATLDESYNQMVAFVGNLKAASDVAASVSADNLNTITDRRDSISAVSLDEEFSNLITFQKAYQAAARMIKVADDLLSQVVQLL